MIMLSILKLETSIVQRRIATDYYASPGHATSGLHGVEVLDLCIFGKCLTLLSRQSFC